MTDCVCLAHSIQKGTQLHADQKGSTWPNFWCQEISPIFVGKKVFLRHGPQTIDHVAWTKKQNSDCGSHMITKGRHYSSLLINMMSSIIRQQNMQTPIVYPVCQYTVTGLTKESMRSD